MFGVLKNVIVVYVRSAHRPFMYIGTMVRFYLVIWCYDYDILFIYVHEWVKYYLFVAAFRPFICILLYCVILLYIGI